MRVSVRVGLLMVRLAFGAPGNLSSSDWCGLNLNGRSPLWLGQGSAERPGRIWEGVSWAGWGCLWNRIQVNSLLFFVCPGGNGIPLCTLSATEESGAELWESHAYHPIDISLGLASQFTFKNELRSTLSHCLGSVKLDGLFLDNLIECLCKIFRGGL